MHESELYGLRGGLFNSDRTKFFAYTYARFDSVEFDNYWGVLLGFGWYSIFGDDDERSKKWIDEHHCQSKSMEEYVKEGVYLAWCVRRSS